MKKSISIMISLVLVLCLSMTAFAATNTDGFGITLNQIGGNSNTLCYTSFPQTYNISGTVTYPMIDTNNGGSIDNQTIQVKLYVGLFAPTFDENGKLTNISAFGDLIGQDTVQRNSVDQTSSAFNLAWIINEPNTYYVLVTAKKANAIVDDWQLVDVRTITATEPAAPAVAADLLKAAGISAKYSKTGNYISDVAHEMGPTTYFDGVSKSAVYDYRVAVAAFLNKELAANGDSRTVHP